MDNFSVFGSSFDNYLENLNVVVKICVETNLVLNWEKCDFMIKKELSLVIKFQKKKKKRGYLAKVELIKKLPPVTNVKGIRSFLGHVGFYRRCIKDCQTSTIQKRLLTSTTFCF